MFLIWIWTFSKINKSIPDFSPCLLSSLRARHSRATGTVLVSWPNPIQTSTLASEFQRLWRWHSSRSVDCVRIGAGTEAWPTPVQEKMRNVKLKKPKISIYKSPNYHFFFFNCFTQQIKNIHLTCLFWGKIKICRFRKIEIKKSRKIYWLAFSRRNKKWETFSDLTVTKKKKKKTFFWLACSRMFRSSESEAILSLRSEVTDSAAVLATESSVLAFLDFSRFSISFFSLSDKSRFSFSNEAIFSETCNGVWSEL